MEVVLLYHGQKVLQVTTAGPEGCFILKGQVPLGNEKIYGPCRAEQLSFPSPDSVSLPSDMAKAMNLLLCHLERGVLLWVAPDGLFIKRFCQGRVYWSGPMAQHTDRPNKLERDKTFKLLDVPTFLGGKTGSGAAGQVRSNSVSEVNVRDSRPFLSYMACVCVCVQKF